jgi:hypothetical protein
MNLSWSAIGNSFKNHSSISSATSLDGSSDVSMAVLVSMVMSGMALITTLSVCSMFLLFVKMQTLYFQKTPHLLVELSSRRRDGRRSL